MKILQGKAASRGLSSGNAVIFTREDILQNVQPRELTSVDEEKAFLKKAVDKAIRDLRTIQNTIAAEAGESSGHIFRAQITMLEDTEFIEEICEVIEHGKTVETAVQEVLELYTSQFEQMGENDYNRQRVSDLEDVCQRIMRIVLNVEGASFKSLPPDSMLIADDLLPSDTAEMDKRHISGIVCQRGGTTSHVAILANNLGIPSVVHVDDLLDHIHEGDKVFIDTRDPQDATVIVNPAGEDLEALRKEVTDYQRLQQELMLEDLKDVVTLDGHPVKISANIGSEEDLQKALEFGACSVGLLRTEFIFIDDKRLQNEEEQFRYYKRVAEAFSHGMVVIRTLDVGGDKLVQGMEVLKEDNPFLGRRGIRLCLENPELFRTQLRAIIRASSYGNIHIMLPMISDLEEVRKVKQIIDEIRIVLIKEGYNIPERIPLGIMIETPAAVLLADRFCREVDFVSIGTNDLTQYLLAADRNNSGVADYYRIYSPAVFLAIDKIVSSACTDGCWVGVCGELGGMLHAIPILIGLGVDELSMSARLMPEAVRLIRSLKYSDCKKVAQKAIMSDTEDEIKEHAIQFLKSDTRLGRQIKGEG